MAKYRISVGHSSAADSWSQYCERGLWQCHASPFGAHHWSIDALGQGECRYCGQKRRFAEPAGVGCWELSSYDEGFVLEEFVRKLLTTV